MPDYESWKQYFQHDSLFSNAIRLQVLIRTISKYAKPGSRLLETGVGSGNTGLLLSNLGYDVTLLDIEGGLINSFQERFPGHVSNKKIKMLLGNLYDLPFVDNSYDVVYHQGVLEHFDDQHIITALREQSRVGRLVVIDVPNSKYRDRPYGDERWISNKKWSQFIKESSLDIIEISGRRVPHWANLFPHFLFLPGIYDRLNIGGRLGVVSIFVCQQKIHSVSTP